MPVRFSLLFYGCLIGSGLKANAAYPESPGLGLILSEVMADPTAVADAQGEFLELENVTSDTVQIPSLQIQVSGQNLDLKSLKMAPGKFLLICKDSLPSTNGGMVCQRQWPQLALANSRSDTVTLIWADGQVNYVLGIPKPGVSWENTGEKMEDYQRFLPSGAVWAGVDSATPGFRNSRSTDPPRFDLGITEATVGRAGKLAVQIRDFGSERYKMESAPGKIVFLTLRLDRDWDGDWETLVDSQALVDLLPNGEELLIPIDPGIEGLVLIQLSSDDNPSNNSFSLLLGPPHSLVLNEWCPAPESGSPEWVEIRNASSDSGGQGRTLSLAQVAFNGQILGAKAGELSPGEYVILTEDANRFRNRYGLIKVRVIGLGAWPGLRNSGDTLRLTLKNFPIDSVVYHSDALSGSGGCLARGQREAAIGSGTPGFTEIAIVGFSWGLGTRIASIDKPLEVTVEAPMGFKYTVRVFDLEGNCVRNLGEGGPGRHIYHWAGEDAKGGKLRPGPYLICLSAEGHRTHKRTVVLVGGR